LSDERIMQIAFGVPTVIALIINALVLFPSQAQEQKRAPENFSYPPSAEIVQINKAIKSKSLSGAVTDPSGAAASDVLVEKLADNWGKSIEAVLTDSKGYFALAEGAPGVYFLKLSKPGFDSMLLKVEVTTKKANSKLKIKLRLSA